MCRSPSEDGFLFTSSRIGLLRSGVPERSALLSDYTSPPGFSPSCDFDPPRSRKVTLLPPLSPFGQVPALLPFPFLGRFDCSLHRPRWPVPALLLSQTTCTGCAMRDWYGRSSLFDCYGSLFLWVPEVTLRLPVFPFGGDHPRCRTDRSFRIDPRSCEQASPVIRHWVSVRISSSALIHVHRSIQSHRSVTFILLGACLPDLAVWGTPHLVRFSSDLMAHHRSRIGSLVGWGLPVTLSAPTPLLGSGKVCVARGGS